ncbi:hypothetical protein OEZ86_009920 [Tetradesmus obliquus]|nr:hypothetical protein OEZ86_009920 [Tetradesmus obliquus]
MVTCGICFETTKEIGELDSCDHRFCWPCITQWSERETRCPFCKQRFSLVCRKALYLGDPHSEPPSKRHKPNSTAADAAPAAAAALAGNAAADEAAREQQNSGSSSPSSPRGKLDGVVLETKRVAARDQVYMPEGDVADFLQALHCMVCGGDENEEQLLICDGCDNGYHTYCVHLRAVPLGTLAGTPAGTLAGTPGPPAGLLSPLGTVFGGQHSALPAAQQSYGGCSDNAAAGAGPSGVPDAAACMQPWLKQEQQHSQQQDEQPLQQQQQQQQHESREQKELSDEQKRDAKRAAHAIAKARLALLYSKQKISKEVYSAVLKDATHVLYERVKAGAVALRAVLAAADAAGHGTAAEGSSSSSAAAVRCRMDAMLNGMLEDAGVAARL